MPVEIVQFCWKYNLERLQKLPELAGASAKLRMESADKPYVTDNSNYIVDLYFEEPIKDPHAGACSCLPLTSSSMRLVGRWHALAASRTPYRFLFACMHERTTRCHGG